MILPFKLNRLYRVIRWGGRTSKDEFQRNEDIELVDRLDEADIVSSQWGETNLHTFIVDIDIPAQLIESSTPGHHHLYIDRLMTWDQYVKVLDALADAGIIEKGYAEASKFRGFTAVRLPWVHRNSVRAVRRDDSEEEEFAKWVQGIGNTIYDLREGELH